MSGMNKEAAKEELRKKAKEAGKEMVRLAVFMATVVVIFIGIAYVTIWFNEIESTKTRATKLEADMRSMENDTRELKRELEQERLEREGTRAEGELQFPEDKLMEGDR